jgi:hypothetical protein
VADLAKTVRDALPTKTRLMGKSVDAAARTVHDAVHSMSEFRRVMISTLVFLQDLVLDRESTARTVDDGQASSFTTVSGTVGA